MRKTHTPPGTPSPFASPPPSDYSGPGSIYEVNSEGYDAHYEEENPWGTGEPPPPEWTHPKTVLKDGTVTELLVARAIERRVSKSGEEKIVLVCPSRLPPSKSLDPKESQGLFRWLWVFEAVAGSDAQRADGDRHVQQTTSTCNVEHAFQAIEVSHPPLAWVCP
jgi:hypothetical protein